MRAFPLADPGDPELGSPFRFLTWVAKGQLATLLGGMAFGIVWMCGQAAAPYVVGKAIDLGVAGHNTRALIGWSLGLLGVGLVQAGAGVMRHRWAVTNWMFAMFRVEQLLTRKAARLGGSLKQRIDLGDVVSTATSDAMHIGNCLDITARAAGSVVAFVAVAAVMLETSVELGLVVLIGVPLLMVAIGPVLKPLHRRQTQLRSSVSQLTSFGADTVAGLRVLRGVGGEGEFVERYRARSQDVRRKGVSVAGIESVLDAAQVLLPGVFVVIVTWLGARLAMTDRISVGSLVSFYGYAAFLLAPMKVATEAAQKFTRGIVGARRVLRVLSLQPLLADPPTPRAAPDNAGLVDTLTGFFVQAGEFVAVAATEPQAASALADRLGRHIDPPAGHEVRLGDVPLTSISIDEVRRRILVSDKDPRLFAGQLREQLDPFKLFPDDALSRTITVASAQDAVESVPDGLDGVIDENARGLSGGQRQRLALVRALLTGPETLILDEPTSAVDAYTEAQIAAALYDARRGKTTVVMTTSPLLLGRADRVVLLDDNHAIATGTHHELSHADSRYRRTVEREEESA